MIKQNPLPIEGYFKRVLSPQLQACGLSAGQELRILLDVRDRLSSVLARWHNVPFRRTVLLLGLEEAVFLEPSAADLETRALVVVAIRNSLIEDLGADKPSTAALQLAGPVITDKGMALFTKMAIEHFQTFGVTQTPEAPTLNADWFGSLAKDFPRAWHALSHIANTNALEVRYELPAPPVTDAPGSPDQPVNKDRPQIVSVVQSGMDPEFDPGLLAYLQQIKDRQVPFFFCDSFKGLTRNPRKLCRVIEIVLAHGVPFVTHNYYLGPTYASRRHPLLRPFHQANEVEAKLVNQLGVSERHGEVLRLIKASLRPVFV
jgi:hypothetical protein